MKLHLGVADEHTKARSRLRLKKRVYIIPFVKFIVDILQFFRINVNQFGDVESVEARDRSSSSSKAGADMDESDDFSDSNSSSDSDDSCNECTEGEGDEGDGKGGGEVQAGAGDSDTEDGDNGSISLAIGTLKSKNIANMTRLAARYRAKAKKESYVANFKCNMKQTSSPVTMFVNRSSTDQPTLSRKYDAHELHGLLCAIQNHIRTVVMHDDAATINGFIQRRHRIPRLHDPIKMTIDSVIHLDSSEMSPANPTTNMIDKTQLKFENLRAENNKDTPDAERLQTRYNEYVGQVSQRLKGKNGRIVGTMMGKRMPCGMRAVVVGDSSLEADQVGVPIGFKPFLIASDTVKRGDSLREMRWANLAPYLHARTIHGGVVWKREGDAHLASHLASHLEELLEEHGELHLERPMEDGDPIIVNRQPSLHHYSLLQHRVRFHNGNTICLPPEICAPYNADFDGDEMNMYVGRPVDCRNLGVSNNILMKQTGLPVAGVMQDGILGNALMTSPHRSFELPRCVMQNLMNAAPAMLELFDADDCDCGLKNIVPTVLKKLGVTVTARNKSMPLTSRHLGASEGGILHQASTQVDGKTMLKLLSTLQKVGTKFVDMVGHSISIEDLMRSKRRAAGAPGDVEAAILEDDDNPFVQMVKFGSKGSMANLLQMVVCLGEQSLPTQREIIPNGQTFISASFLDGLGSTDLFLHSASARVVLIVKPTLIPVPGMILKKMAKNFGELLVTTKAGCVVYNTNGRVVSFDAGVFDVTRQRSCPAHLGCGGRPAGPEDGLPVDIGVLVEIVKQRSYGPEIAAAAAASAAAEAAAAAASGGLLDVGVSLSGLSEELRWPAGTAEAIVRACAAEFPDCSFEQLHVLSALIARDAAAARGSEGRLIGMHLAQLLSQIITQMCMDSHRSAGRVGSMLGESIHDLRRLFFNSGTVSHLYVDGSVDHARARALVQVKLRDIVISNGDATTVYVLPPKLWLQGGQEASEWFEGALSTSDHDAEDSMLVVDSIGVRNIRGLMESIDATLDLEHSWRGRYIVMKFQNSAWRDAWVSSCAREDQENCLHSGVLALRFPKPPGAKQFNSVVCGLPGVFEYDEVTRKLHVTRGRTAHALSEICFRDLIRLDERVICDEPDAIVAVMGIEAARSSLYNRLCDAYVDHRVCRTHLHLVCDIMAVTGSVQSVTRMICAPTNFLSACAHAQPLKVLFEGAISDYTDDLKMQSSRLAMGQHTMRPIHVSGQQQQQQQQQLSDDDDMMI